MDMVTLAERAVSQHGAQQKAGEFAVLLALAASLDPAVIVEVGCFAGGTLWAWTHLAPTVIGVDLAAPTPPVSPQVTMVVGDSHDPATLAELEQVLGGRQVDVLFVDGDHSEAGVRADVQTYGPLVRPGGLIALHDVLPHVGSDVARYWQQVQGLEIRCAPYSWGGIGVTWR